MRGTDWVVVAAMAIVVALVALAAWAAFVEYPRSLARDAAWRADTVAECSRIPECREWLRGCFQNAAKAERQDLAEQSCYRSAWVLWVKERTE